MECAVLAVLFLFAALLAQVQYGLYGGFLMPGGYSLVRQAVFCWQQCWVPPPPWEQS